MASNPVFDRIDKQSRQGYAGFGRAPQQPTGATPMDTPTPQQLQDLYNQPTAGPAQMRRLTIDDVVMKTTGLFAIVVVVAVVAWQLTPSFGLPLMLGGIAATLVLGLVIAFKKTISVPLILAYAVFEGMLVGSISNVYAVRFDEPGTPVFQGIVAQAVLATLSVFAGMLIAYKTGIIKVTEKFRRIVTMAVMGYAIFALINLVYVLVTPGSSFGIGGTSPLGIGISLFAIGLASAMLAVDFDSIDRAIAAGAPEKYSWLLAHGLIVTLVWLYLEILRLLGRLRNN
ncbi:Bax inhibitor-1/YccA family protein [Pedococcus sp. KACC 23699]|uniref:Bax inhibitor-1/YccA family protein n=1 Tax=Pedococcus sp. KACC 23699 TaxID=3149228 RepID=A0AAU7JWF8_9MICO